MGKATQCDKIIQYMKDYGSITPLDAIREFGCMRLAARIADIKKTGDYVIIKEMETSKNRYLETIRYARYRLEDY